jgi:hypothetical protein
MTGAMEMTDRHGRLLAELSELGLSLARKIHEQAMAADTPEATAELAMAFHRISRSARQTMALEAKLKRDHDRDLIEDAARTADRDQAARKHRKAQVDTAISRLIWTEAERDEDLETGDLLVELKNILDEESLSEDFLDGPVEPLIARIREGLGLAASAPFPLAAGEGVGREPDG